MSEQLCTVEFLPSPSRASVPVGGTILDAARACGRDPGIDATCGGRGECGSCLIRVVSGEVSLPGDGASERPGGLRLACRTRVLSDVMVEVPVSSERFQVAGCGGMATPEPGFVRIPLTLSADDTDEPDSARIKRALDPDLEFDTEGLRSVSGIRQGFSGWAIVRGRTVTGLLPDGPPLGLAVDLGTTKIAGYLMNMDTGEPVGADALSNPQSRFGADIMTRLDYACQSVSSARELTDASRAGIARLADQICADTGHSPTCIVELAVCANTSMHHLFCGLDVRGLASAPYTPVTCDPIDMPAISAQLTFAPEARVHMLPPVAGFVGGDHTAMLPASDLPAHRGTALAIDVGTNTEISLSRDGEVTCCSCASGPAFEGAHIERGMRAQTGAIDRVWLSDEQIRFHVLGDIEARGFCGGGLIDLLSVLLDSGRCDPSGRLSPDESGHARCSLGTVEISQRDIRQLQLAKAAIRSGIEQLMAVSGVDGAQIDRVYIAGAFGRAIDPSSAIRIGLFPPIDPKRFRFIGNAAGAGARMCLLSVARRREAALLARKIRHLELARGPGYTDTFIRYLNFSDGGEIDA